MLKVLVVDNDADFVNSLSELLNRYDISVVATGTNGKDAAELYTRHNPDLVILEMELSEYDGYYAIKKIKGQDADAKIIVNSAYNIKKGFKESEVSAVLSKNTNFSKLLETIKEVCN